MSALSLMDRRSRVLWQDAAAHKRQWYAKPGFMFKRSSGVVADVKFDHRALLKFARRGDTFDPYWWS